MRPTGTALAVWSVYGLIRQRAVAASAAMAANAPRQFLVSIPPHPDFSGRKPK